ncbi:MAG: vWA domain-containing protein [Hydrogenovibrio sp.]
MMNGVNELIEVWRQWPSVVFQTPEAFALWGLVAVLWAWHYWRPAPSDWEQAVSAQSLVFRHTLIDRLGGATPKMPTFKAARLVMGALRWLLLATVITALAQPVQRIPLPPEPQTKTVRDIVFVVEASVSMVLEDYELNGEPTSRIAAIKQVLDQFISGLAGNRFGVIVYADEAYTLMPLTSDGTTARLMLKRLEPYLAGRTDEGEGAALGLALQQVAQGTESTENRVVVLISDGSTRDSRLPIAEAIHYAQGLNVPIYTVGIGSQSEDADQRAFSGLLYEPLESESLKRIATETGGRYHQVGSGADLQQVLQAIDQAEGVAVEVPSPLFADKALYPYLLGLALSVFGVYLVLLQWLARRLQEANG